MATFSALQTALALDLRDTGNVIFSTTMLARFLNKALQDVGRVAPVQFVESIATVVDQIEYTPTNSSEWMDVVRVEVWNTSTTPDEFVRLIPPRSREYVNQTAAGWYVWGGKLYIPPVHAGELDAALHVLKVWGYGNYTEKSGSDAMPTGEKEHAIMEGARVQALKSLLQNRNLYTQWQALGTNSDVSLAGLTAQLANAQDEYRRTLKAITILRGGD